MTCIWIGFPGWSPRSLRLLPDGCVDLAWDGTAVTVIPPRAAPVRHNLTARDFTAGVRLRAGWAAQMLQVSIGSLPDVSDLLDVRSDARFAGTAETLAQMADPAAAARLLARSVACLWPGSLTPDARLLSAIERLAQPGSSVRAAAADAGYSVRELHRRFTSQVGLPPKSFQRVARFQRFRNLMSSSDAPLTMAEAAALCGYADEAHLAHECHDLAARTPAVLARAAAIGRLPPWPPGAQLRRHA